MTRPEPPVPRSAVRMVLRSAGMDTEEFAHGEVHLSAALRRPCDRIIAAGGDGTAAPVVSEIVETDSPSPSCRPEASTTSPTRWASMANGRTCRRDVNWKPAAARPLRRRRPVGPQSLRRGAGFGGADRLRLPPVIRRRIVGAGPGGPRRAAATVLVEPYPKKFASASDGRNPIIACELCCLVGA